MATPRLAAVVVVVAVGCGGAAWWHATRAGRLRASYRLGDTINGYLAAEHGGCQPLRRWLAANYPGSIADAYAAATCKANNWAVLCDIIRSRAPPRADTAVVHMRLGDVAESADIAAVWRGRRPCSYIYPRAFYTERVIPELSARNVTTVVLVGSSRHCTRVRGCRSSHSQWYRAQLTQLLRSRGFAIRNRWNQPADDDFMVMATAGVFVPSGGGFSAAAARCARSTVPPRRAVTTINK